MSRFLLLLLLLNIALTGRSSTSNMDYSFKQISINEGLTQSTVTAIVEDYMGDIWIGTKNGLNKFNQYELVNYYANNTDFSLPDNKINFIAQDSVNHLWIGTDKGLSLYDRKNNHFKSITYNDKPFSVYAFKLHDGGVLFGGIGVIYYYDYKKETIEAFFLDASLSNLMITSLTDWAGNKLIIGCRYGGVFVFDKQQQSLSRLELSDGDIPALYVDNDQRLWISSYERGITCLAANGEPLFELNSSNSRIETNIILDFIERDGKIWFATDGKGIYIYDPMTHQIENIREESSSNFTFFDNSVQTLYKDCENNIWAGSIRSGLFRIKEVSISTFGKVPLGISYGLSNDVVISLYEETDGTLWIGTDGGGINSFNPVEHKFNHYSDLYGLSVVSIAPLNQDELLLSVFGKGLFRFNKFTQQLTPFLLRDSATNKYECFTGNSVYIDRISSDKFLFMGKRIYIYDVKSRSFSTVDGVDDYYQQTLQKASVDKETAILFGANHLLSVNAVTHRAHVLYDNHGEFNITSAFYADQVVWIGSNTGLYRYDIPQNKIEKIETNLFQNVSTVVCDNDRLWIGAQNILFCYLIHDSRFIIFNESDGAYANEYFPMNIYRSHTSNQYLGGTTGLVCINKEIGLESDIIPDVQLTAVNINGISKFDEVLSTPSNKLTILGNTNSIEIKVDTRDLDILRKKVFRYEIAGLNDRYIETYNNVLNLSGLAPGSYTIFVSCISPNGTWTLPQNLMQLKVLPPIWKRGWFIFLELLFTIALVVLIFYIIEKRNKDRLKWKMKEHEKEINDKKIRFLINISHELRTPLTLIYAPLKRIINGELIKDDLITKELTVIYNNAKQMKNLINMVLDLRKMEVGHETVNLKVVTLNEWIKAVADDFSYEFRAKNIELHYQFAPEVIEISFDQKKSSIILSNLLMNALKYSLPHSFVIISTEILSADRMVRIAVKDSGKGIKDLDVERLFERFYRASIDEVGSGIGLAYSKSLAEIQQGRVGGFDNGPHKGATFYFDLPLITTAEVRDCIPKPYINEIFGIEEFDAIEDIHPADAGIGLSAYKILIVDDNHDMIDFLKSSISSYFDKVYLAYNGEEAMRLITEYKPDLIVSDIMMPQVSGFELCRWLKSEIQVSHIPIILLTARNDSESSITGYKLGADMYMPKPFDLNLLLGAIQSILGNREKIKSRFNSNYFLPTVEESTHSNADETFMCKLNQIISANLDNSELDVMLIANQIAMSRSSLYNKLKVLTGMGVNDYINKFRIEKAAHLLKNTDFSITEISERTGFSYQRYFSSVFKQVYGVTPTQFRNKMNKPA